ncbi:MAG: type II toxin-antitoxin system RelE/ParE family toxin [Prevotellaceae bacterium]|jgi:plasmid stabilization system protein ParE|nr:type II toxin-antitoxin system RelE/ParE family toxin [Prevotellaceae bacterium]
MVIDWTDKAKRHLKSIFDFYVETAGRKTAIEMVTDIKVATKPLTKFPQMAAIEPILSDLPEKFRSLVVCKHYKVIYYVNNKVVHIFAIWDCRQNPDNLKIQIKQL